MRKYMNEKGFTLIEMMIVLLVISVLLLITIPNMSKNSAAINDKGCDAYLQMVQSQIEVYKMEKKGVEPTLEKLETDDYIPSITCPNGKDLIIENGKVTVAGSNAEDTSS